MNEPERLQMLERKITAMQEQVDTTIHNLELLLAATERQTEINERFLGIFEQLQNTTEILLKLQETT